MKNPLIISSIIKAFQLVDCFCGPIHEFTLTQLAMELNISIGSAQRITHTLMSLGYLTKDSKTKEYRLSPKWLTIGFAFLDQIDLSKIALPHLTELNEQTKEDVSLAVRDGDEVLYVERLPTSYMVTTKARPGLRRPIEVNSMGKAILAFLDNHEREKILNRILSRNEISDKEKEKIENELKKIRKSGYAINKTGFGEGVFAVAVPIMNHEGVAFAGMNISIPMSRISKNKIYREYLPRLIEKGKLISLELGYTNRPDQYLEMDSD